MTALVLALENLLFPLGALAVVLKFLFSPRRGALAALLSELPERLGSPAAEGLAGKRPYWVHCASAGEVNAAAALLAKLKAEGACVVVTTTTAAGKERAKALPSVDRAFLAPLDFWAGVSAFLDAVKPRALIVVETELWPHMIELAAQEGLPCVLVNGRMTDKTFRRYRRFQSLVRPFLARFSVVAAQTEADAARYRELGAAKVVVTGNLKFDVPNAGAASPELRTRFAELGWADAPIFCAGSTHPAEEQAVARAYLAARKARPNLKLIAAPRHVERAVDCVCTLEAEGVSVALWSKRETGRDAVVIDALGELAGLYALASVSFVGGTLVSVGGHNLLEPALAGVPVLFGPHTKNAAEAARLLESSGGGFCATDGERLAALLTDLLGDEDRLRGARAAALKTAHGLQGALERTWALLRSLL